MIAIVEMLPIRVAIPVSSSSVSWMTPAKAMLLLQPGLDNWVIVYTILQIR